MLAFQPAAILQAESILHIEHAFAGMLRGLALFEADAPQHIIIYRKPRHGAHPLCNRMALVVATLPLAPTGDGHGQQGIDAIEEALSSKLASSHATQCLANLGHGVVFQVVNQLAVGCLWIIVEECRSPLHGKLPPEEARHRIVERRAFEMGERQVQMTSCAEHLLARRQTATAHGAAAGRHHIEQLSPETRPHRSRPYTGE